MRDKTRQSGSTAVFVVCAVVLVLIALGVLYGVRRVAMNDQTPPMTVPESSESGDSQDSGDANNGGETVWRPPAAAYSVWPPGTRAGRKFLATRHSF